MRVTSFDPAYFERPIQEEIATLRWQGRSHCVPAGNLPRVFAQDYSVEATSAGLA
jgi:hypothetical protein